jgi:hypothetical protein
MYTGMKKKEKMVFWIIYRSINEENFAIFVDERL